MRRERAPADLAGDARDRDLEQRSTDGTAGYLDSLDDPRITVVHSERNIGQNAYAEAFRADHRRRTSSSSTTTSSTRRRTGTRCSSTRFKRLPSIGFLAADLEDDPHDLASRYRHHVRPHEYEPVEENGVRLLRGPAGGGCAITSRELNERVGGFRQDKKRVFWLEDQAYIEDIVRLGYGAAVLADLRVHHTGGPHYTKASEEKARLLAALRTETGEARSSEACALQASGRTETERALRVVSAAVVTGACER